MTDDQVVRRFHELYAGAAAQEKRDSGNPDAMPPWAEVYWLGRQVIKCPMDLWTYQEIIFETRPDVLIETGTNGGGSAFFFATLFDLIGTGHVFTVDKDPYPELWKPHPRITYMVGDSISLQVAGEMASAAQDKRCMVSLDALHTYEHVAKELSLYAPLVSSGCYLVVEDTGWAGPQDIGNWADRAAREFIDTHPEFTVDESREKHLLTSNRGGWIRRK